MSDDQDDAKRIARLHEEHPEKFNHSPFCHQHPTNKGPSQVSSKEYRKNYDAIFGRVPVGQA